MTQSFVTVVVPFSAALPHPSCLDPHVRGHVLATVCKAAGFCMFLGVAWLDKVFDGEAGPAQASNEFLPSVQKLERAVFAMPATRHRR